MVARFSLAERSEGQRASWITEQPNTMQKVFWMETERALGQEVRAEVAAFNLAPEMIEAVARDQLLSADAT
jgi:type IV secretion system T-DNA border endonuclease VirD2